MADYEELACKHATLVAATVDTVTLTAVGLGFRIQNRDAASGDGLYYTKDGSTPTVGGDDTFYLPPGGTDTWPDTGKNLSVVVSLISAGTPDYSVESW